MVCAVASLPHSQQSRQADLRVPLDPMSRCFPISATQRAPSPRTRKVPGGERLQLAPVKVHRILERLHFDRRDGLLLRRRSPRLPRCARPVRPVLHLPPLQRERGRARDQGGQQRAHEEPPERRMATHAARTIPVQGRTPVQEVWDRLARDPLDGTKGERGQCPR